MDVTVTKVEKTMKSRGQQRADLTFSMFDDAFMDHFFLLGSNFFFHSIQLLRLRLFILLS